MQRDMKIGMALGVALIGIVGALFFRREPEVSKDQTPPPVENLEQLDKDIAEHGKGPYNQKIAEHDESAAPAPSANGTAKPVSDRRTDKGGKKDGKSRDLAGSNAGSTHDTLGSLGADDPLTDELPAHNRDWEPAAPSSATGLKAGQAPGAPGSAASAGRTHVIQAGDTLSSLAARYLGSATRYHEIYEANRSQLRSPNDVREGMTLNIPDKGKSRDTQHTADANDDLGPAANRFPSHVSKTKTNLKPKAQSLTRRRTVPVNDGEEDSNSDDTTESAAPTSKLRFVPVHGSPFSAGRR